MRLRGKDSRKKRISGYGTSFFYSWVPFLGWSANPLGPNRRPGPLESNRGFDIFRNKNVPIRVGFRNVCRSRGLGPVLGKSPPHTNMVRVAQSMVRIWASPALGSIARRGRPLVPRNGLSRPPFRTIARRGCSRDSEYPPRRVLHPASSKTTLELL